MTKILFVCHGNICRSVMAEMVMRHLVAEAGREDEFMIDSCATSREEIGNDIYPPAKRCLSARKALFISTWCAFYSSCGEANNEGGLRGV